MLTKRFRWLYVILLAITCKQSTIDLPVLLTDHTQPTAKIATAVSDKASVNLPTLPNLPSIYRCSNTAATAM
jgi:hypothetical protein